MARDMGESYAQQVARRQWERIRRVSTSPPAEAERTRSLAADAEVRGVKDEGTPDKHDRITAEITSAHDCAQGHRPSAGFSQWSAPSAIEARMLGIADLAARDSSHARRTTRNSPPGGSLPQEIRELILRLSRTQGREQAVAAERMRQLVHNKAASGMIARESWPLEVMAQVVLHGDESARTSCCACFRHLALEDDGCARMIASAKVLTALGTAVRMGEDSAKQKSAAALGNLAWRSEDSRAAICQIEGIVAGLLDLLLGPSVRSKESALAALSNITLSNRCTLEVSGSTSALQLLCAELISGTEKGRLRAAGILRNLALDPKTRGTLVSFPGLLSTLDSVRRETSNTETMQRAEAALISLREEQLAFQERGPGDTMFSPCHLPCAVQTSGHIQSNPITPKKQLPSFPPSRSYTEPEAMEILQHWLTSHEECWDDIQAQLLDAGHTSYDAYSDIEPNMITLDEQGGLYLYKGRTLQLVGADRYNPTLLVDIENRKVIWDLQTETEFANPWARQHFVCKVEGRSSMILLKRTGRVVARHDSNKGLGHIQPNTSLHSSPTNQATAVPVEEVANLSDEDVASTATPPCPNSARTSPPPASASTRAASKRAAFLAQEKAKERWKPEVLTDAINDPCLQQLLQWGSANGWHDLQRRLLDAGKTDYSKYAVYEKQMTPVAGQKDSFHYKDRILRLVGMNRQNPRRLIDDLTREILWDFETATKFSFPWARQQFRIIKDPPIGPPKAGDKLKILDKTSNTPLIQLEIPPPPLINAHSAATTGERPMGVQDGNGSADYTQAVDLLKDWTTKNGWHDLQSRLFEAGRTDYRDYAQIEPKMQDVPGHPHKFEFEGRILILSGKRKSPTTLTDEATGEVLWDRAKHTIFANPWARTHFEVAKKGNTVTVLDKNSGALVSECVAQKCTQGDAFLMQSVLLDSVSNVTRLNLSEVLNGDLEIVQVVRAFGESVADRAGGGRSIAGCGRA